MKLYLALTGLALTGVLAAADTNLFATGAHFWDFTPLTASAGPTSDESRPITFGNPLIAQRSIADRNTQLAAQKPNTGSWDMLTVNQAGGPSKGRFLFTVFETGQSGVQRHDLLTGETQTVWMSPAAGQHVSFDASYWTPWGTFITAEESWGTGSSYGRLFELRNPFDAPAVYSPVNSASNSGAVFVHANAVPRTSHEGIQFDHDLNMYFIDELNGGAIYKFTSSVPMRKIVSGRASYFDAGQTFVLRVGTGLTPNATGAFTWVPITDVEGRALPGGVTVTDANGVTSVDARATADLAAFKGTDYQRPEDLQVVRFKDGHEWLFVTTTTTHETYRIDLQAQTISVYANRATIDLATGSAIGTAFANPDNLAVDALNHLYIVEDREGAVDDDIWMAVDLNGDGDLLDAGEGLARWASNGTPGSEFTGLYFDPFNEQRAWVNIQHPASGNDRTIEITIP